MALAILFIPSQNILIVISVVVAVIVRVDSFERIHVYDNEPMCVCVCKPVMAKVIYQLTYRISNPVKRPQKFIW